MYFIMTIWHQAISEDSSIEIYVRKCLSNGDIHWFPSGVLHEVPVMEDKRGEHLEGGEEEKKILHSHQPNHGPEGGGHASSHGGGHGPHGGHSDSKSAIKNSLTRQGSQVRKTLLFQELANHATTKGNGIEELLEKMTVMQRQITKLSKDIYQQERDRLNSNTSLELALTSQNISPFTSQLNTSNGLAAVLPSKISTEDDSYESSSGYSSTSSSQSTEEEEKENDLSERKEKEELQIDLEMTDTLKNLPILSKAGISPRISQKSHMDNSVFSDTSRSSLVSPKRSTLNRARSKLSEESVSTRKKRTSTLRSRRETSKDIKNKVNQMDQTLQLIMKKLETLETGISRKPSAIGNAKPGETEPEVNSGTNESRRSLVQNEIEIQTAIVNPLEKKLRPQSAYPNFNYQDTSDSNGEISPIRKPNNNILRPQSANPYSASLPFKNPFDLNEQIDMINRMKKQKRKKEKKEKKEPPKQGFMGPPKELLNNLWVQDPPLEEKN